MNNMKELIYNLYSSNWFDIMYKWISLALYDVIFSICSFVVVWTLGSMVVNKLLNVIKGGDINV